MGDPAMFFSQLADFGAGAFGLLLLALLSGLLAALLELLLPRQMRNVQYTIAASPVDAALVGFFSVLALITGSVIYVLSLFFIVPLVLLPVIILLWLVLLLLALIGVVILAAPFGQWLLGRRAVETVPLVESAVGAFCLTGALGVLAALPIIGWLVTLLGCGIALTGLGALLLTRLGTRRYPTPITVTDSSPLL